MFLHPITEENFKKLAVSNINDFLRNPLVSFHYKYALGKRKYIAKCPIVPSINF